MSRPYPEMTDEIMTFLWVLKNNMEKDPDYVKNSPYDAWVKDFLNSRMKAPSRLYEGEGELETEIVNLYNEMNDFGGLLDTDDAAQKMAFFRTKTSLLEKLLTLKAQAHNIKKMEEFRNRVLKIMEEVMTEEQKEKMACLV